jgi:hypothetical protein
VAERVREAVMEIERLGAKSRTVAFVLDNVLPEYFRTEAVSAVRPVRGADVQRAVKVAYDVRSRNAHVLEDLPPEAWILGDRADTVDPPDMGTMLSLEGLVRLARHVVRSYVDRAPVEVDPTFDWRASLPGVVHVHAAPQYWIWNVEGFDHKSANPVLLGLRGPLGRHIRRTPRRRHRHTGGAGAHRAAAAGTADGPVKTLMVAIYALWHRTLAPRDHWPCATSLLAKHEHLLQRADVPSFVAGLLSDQLPEWTADQWHTLAIKRRAQRSSRRHLELPAGFDAALQIMAAERLMEAGRTDQARTLARFAVEELSGHEPLMAWEARLASGEDAELDLRALVLALDPDTGPTEEPPEPAGAPAAPPEGKPADHQPGDQPRRRAPGSGDEHEADHTEAADGRPNPTGGTSDNAQRASGEHDAADAQND